MNSLEWLKLKNFKCAFIDLKESNLNLNMCVQFVLPMWCSLNCRITVYIKLSSNE
jgi:hypothetical protein